VLPCRAARAVLPCRAARAVLPCRAARAVLPCRAARAARGAGNQSYQSIPYRDWLGEL